MYTSVPTLFCPLLARPQRLTLAVHDEDGRGRHGVRSGAGPERPGDVPIPHSLILLNKYSN
ncbi:hypothetical protein HanIR_Chr01g0019781 [Helianthus annuus]|nr:hypothetical protein HanIR_Chr01g0019781 [Helianthus annuus]KAJ0783005.1 hypothetical protein HanLR1_Chr01g0015201 [Helianthus annuus]